MMPAAQTAGSTGLLLPLTQIIDIARDISSGEYEYVTRIFYESFAL
jgi:hypothetical protein